MADRLPSRLLLAPDARAAERALLADVEAAGAGNGSNLSIARVAIVVPSAELRRHVLALLVDGGRARLGVQVLTLPALADAVLDRVRGSFGSGVVPDVTPAAVRGGELLFPLLVERFAAREPALAARLAPLENGFAGVTAAARDLADAGLDPGAEARGGLHEAALEALAEGRGPSGDAAADRAAALVRVTVAALAELSRTGLAIESGRQLAAAEALAATPDALPVDRAIVHGFRDATGAAASLLERLFRSVPTTAILAEPPAIDGGGEVEGGWRFGARFRERFEGLASAERLAPASGPPDLSLAPAIDPEQEVGDAIARAAAAIASGIPPERVAIVARDLAPYRAMLERAIDRRALPASGRAGGEHPAARRARAIRELLARGGDEAPLELVLAAVGGRWERRSGFPAATIRQAAHRAGRLRLRDLTAEVGPGSADERPIARVRPLARDLAAELATLAAPRHLGESAAAIRRAFFDSAADDAEAGIVERLDASLDALDHEPLTSFRATPEELGRLLEALWETAGDRPLGGAGGGVALLSVTEARALSFDRLVVAGLSRDRFPRRVGSDPYLPDPLRRALRAVLPDLPVKGEGHDEERFLFAQLLVAAPTVTLSWPRRDEDGRELARSTLVDELVRGKGVPETSLAAPAVEAARLSAFEAAVETALGRSGPGPELAGAIAEGQRRFASRPPALGAEAAAAHLAAILAEYGADPTDAARRDRPGPYFGFAGAPHAADLRRVEAPWVTALETFAACGWRAFLERILRLRPPVVAADELPTLPPSLAGLVVHRVLESIVAPERRGGALADALDREAVPAPWPREREIDALVESAVDAALREEGIDPALFAPALASAAKERLEVARRIDWSSGGPPILGVELEAASEVPLATERRAVRFRIDRVDRGTAAPEDSARPPLRLTDYKTGKPYSDAKTAATRSRHLAGRVAEGRLLQLAVYALVEESGTNAEARLLYLRPDLDDRLREATIASGDEAPALAPWDVLFPAWDRGTFLPRLLAANRHDPFEECSFCAVRVACLQGDSGARLRLARWIESDPESRRAGEAAPDRAALASARALFALRDRRDSDGPGEGE